MLSGDPLIAEKAAIPRHRAADIPTDPQLLKGSCSSHIHWYLLVVLEQNP